MSHIVRESGRPYPMAANASVTIGGEHVLGFLAAVSGTITITVVDGNVTTGTSTVVVDAIPVTAGIYTPIPITFTGTATIALASGAKGTLII